MLSSESKIQFVALERNRALAKIIIKNYDHVLFVGGIKTLLRGDRLLLPWVPSKQALILLPLEELREAKRREPGTSESVLQCPATKPFLH